VPVDMQRSNYYIFEGSYNQSAHDDHIEGFQADRIALTGSPGFWGGGVVWDPPYDLSAWECLWVSLKSNDLADLNITVGSDGAEYPVPASTQGYAPDGAWHQLGIPLRTYADAGVDLTAVRLPFVVGAGGNEGGQSILIDDLYFENCP